MEWVPQELVRGGFTRKNASPRTKKKELTSIEDENMTEDETVDWSYQITNEQLYVITQSRTIGNFVHVQMLKYTARVCRLDNSVLQKQLLFCKNSTNRTWKRVEELLGIDQAQAKRMMMNTENFLRLLDTQFELRQPLPHS